MINCCVIIGVVIFFSILCSLVKKGKVNEKYIIAWGVLGIIAIGMSIFTGKVGIIEQKFSKYYPQSLLILITLIFVIGYIIYITIILTKQNRAIIKLEQELAILKEEIKKKGIQH